MKIHWEWLLFRGTLFHENGVYSQKNTILKLSKTSRSLVPSSRLQLRRHLFCVRGVGPMCTLATVARLVVPMLHVK